MCFGDLPGKEVDNPTKESCIRIVPPKIPYKTVYTFKNKDGDKRGVAAESIEEEESVGDENQDVLIDSTWEEGDAPDPGKNVKRKGTNITPEVVEEPDPLIPRFDEKYYKDLCRRTAMKNSALHSLRCDLQLKFWVAEKFRDEAFYYPYNLDFRGRAYPVPPNLNHLGI